MNARTPDTNTRDAHAWRAEAERQRERAEALQLEVERQRRLLWAFVDHLKAQLRPDADAVGEGGEVVR